MVWAPAAKVLVLNVAVVPLMVPVPITANVCVGVSAVPAVPATPHPAIANKPMVAVRTSKATSRRRAKDEHAMEAETRAMRDLKFTAKTLSKKCRWFLVCGNSPGTLPMPVAVHRRSDTPGSASPGLFNISRGFPNFSVLFRTPQSRFFFGSELGAQNLAWGETTRG
jgi:hypothetical protein